MAIDQEDRAAVGVGKVAGGVVGDHGVLATGLDQQIGVAVVVDVTVLADACELVVRCAVEGDDAVLDLELVDELHIGPVARLAKHQVVNAIARVAGRARERGGVGRAKHKVGDAIAIDVAHRLNLQARRLALCGGRLVGRVDQHRTGGVLVGLHVDIGLQARVNLRRRLGAEGVRQHMPGCTDGGGGAIGACHGGLDRGRAQHHRVTRGAHQVVTGVDGHVAAAESHRAAVVTREL